MDFFLKFTLISYASVFFYSVGLGMAFSFANKIKLMQLTALFGIIFLALHFSFKAESFQTQFVITAIWTSIYWAGFRFGKKVSSK